MPSNLPPGVTQSMIDNRFGGDDHDEPDPVEAFADELADRASSSGLPHAAIARVVLGYEDDDDFQPTLHDHQMIIAAARSRDLIPPGAYLRAPDQDTPLVLIAARALIKTEFID